MTGKELVSLPQRHLVDHKEQLGEEEKKVFKKVWMFADAAMKKFTSQSEEREMLKEGGFSFPQKETSQESANKSLSEYAYQPAAGALSEMKGDVKGSPHPRVAAETEADQLPPRTHSVDLGKGGEGKRGAG